MTQCARWEELQGAGSSKQGKSQGRVRTSRQVPLLKVRVEYTSKRSEGISLLSFHRWSQAGDSKKGNLWQGPDLSHWCTWSPEQGAHSRIVGMLRQQENIFQNLQHMVVHFLMVTWYLTLGDPMVYLAKLL